MILLSRSGVHFVPMAALFSGQDYHRPRRFVLVSRDCYLSYTEGRNMIAGFENDRHNVTIHDARNSPGTFHETGFTLIKLDQVLTYLHPNSMTSSHVIFLNWLLRNYVK